jgi:tetratricopeptide (TPR) repeat protein
VGHLRPTWLILVSCGLAVAAHAQDNKTVLGPTNAALQDGANALRAGDAEEGVRLTLLGLSQAHSSKERETAQSNLCAGYALLGQYERGLAYCDAALQVNGRNWRARSNRALIFIKLRRFEEADADLLVGEEINPGANTIKAVRRMYLDATNPVAPSVVIDDRREAELENHNVE